MRHQRLQLALIFLVCWVWGELEIFINTGQIWWSVRSTTAPTLITLGIYGLGRIVQLNKKMTYEISLDHLHVPEWIYEDQTQSNP